MEKINAVICWFRRDLRIADNAALWHALNSGLPVIPLFIFDTTILDRLEQGSAHKGVNFIHNALSYMEEELIKAGSFLLNIRGNPIDVFDYLINGFSNNETKNSESPINTTQHNAGQDYVLLNEKIDIKAVYCNNDYEASAIERDNLVEALLAKNGIPLHSFKDQVIFEKEQILKNDGTPYSIYTPYSRKWIEKLESSPAKHLREYKTEPLLSNLLAKQQFIELIPANSNSEYTNSNSEYANNNSEYTNNNFTPTNNKPRPTNKKTALTIRTSLPSIEEIGFAPAQLNMQLPYSIPQHIIENYSQTRNFPAIEGTSGISPHLRFGTISIREAVRFAIGYISNSAEGISANANSAEGNSANANSAEGNNVKDAEGKIAFGANGQLLENTWLKELIWRDFFKMILFQFPYVQNEPFKSKYGFIEWRNNPNELEAWCSGNTGYPIVDAGMRELNATGLMHNRVRMITASFLVKHLLIDWRVGEAYFAEKLLDYDLSSNNGNWQWAASSGCDTVPYFRIFNPYEQARKFDPDQTYIKKWVPEVGSNTYPAPICDHKEARERALETYKKALS